MHGLLHGTLCVDIQVQVTTNISSRTRVTPAVLPPCFVSRLSRKPLFVCALFFGFLISSHASRSSQGVLVLRTAHVLSAILLALRPRFVALLGSKEEADRELQRFARREFRNTKGVVELELPEFIARFVVYAQKKHTASRAGIECASPSYQ